MVDLDKSIDMADVQANCRVALKNDSYKLHKILPNKVSVVIFKFRCVKTLDPVWSITPASKIYSTTLKFEKLFETIIPFAIG